MLFGVMIAMPQLIPTVELYLRSVRSEIFKTGEIIPWTYIVTIFAPDFFGNPVTRNDWFGHYAEWNGYAGVIPLVLASIFIFVKKKGVATFFLLVSMVALLLAFNTPFVKLLIGLKIPVLSTSAASRMIVLFSFSIAVLGGLGFDKLLEFIREKPKKVYIWLLGLNLSLILLVGLVYLFALPPDKMSIAKNNSFLPLVILFIFTALTTLLVRIRNNKFKYVFISLVVLILGFDVIRFATKWQAFDPKEKAFMDVGVSEFYKKQNKIDRAVGLAGGEDGVYYRFPVLSGYDPLYDEKYGNFVEYVKSSQFVKPERSVVNFTNSGVHTSQAINFLGVKYIVHKVSDGTFSWAFPFKDYPLDQFNKIFDDGKYRVFENIKAFPRAFVVNNFKVLENDREVLTQMFDNDTDVSKTAFLNNDPKIPSISGDVDSKTSILSYTPSNITISVDASKPGVLVLTDVYYPGWKVTVNEERSKIIKTDYAFRGVVVPQGKSIVRFNYLPDSFLIGTYFSLIGLLGIIIGPVLKSINRKR